jgi:hypothetical protein
MLSDHDIDAFAEDLFNRYGALADIQALKRAHALADEGDERNSRLWFRIRDRVLEMRSGPPFLDAAS